VNTRRPTGKLRRRAPSRRGAAWCATSTFTPRMAAHQPVWTTVPRPLPRSSWSLQASSTPIAVPSTARSRSRPSSLRRGRPIGAAPSAGGQLRSGSVLSHPVSVTGSRIGIPRCAHGPSTRRRGPTMRRCGMRIATGRSRSDEPEAALSLKYDLTGQVLRVPCASCVLRDSGPCRR
jgi:hypothetical protein